MRRRTKLLGWILYWLRERLINLRWRMCQWPDRLNGIIFWLDEHEGEEYWRRKDRGI